MGSYRELRAWQASHDLAVGVYRVTSRWPAGERFGLTAQVRRAAFSAPANIVEGSMRRGSREFRRFLDIAMGSLAEVEYAIEFADAVGVANPGDGDHLRPLVIGAGRLTYLLARGLDRSIRTSPANRSL
jgi:four helix bundle protein